MKLSTVIQSTLVTALLAGCSSLPYATENKFKLGDYEIVTHRDSMLKDLKVLKHPDGTVEYSVAEYTATANAEAIAAASAEAELRTAMLSSSAATTKQLLDVLVEVRKADKQ